MTSALMESFTALLTLGLFAALLCERMLPRVRPRPEAGRLLLPLRQARWVRGIGLLAFLLTLAMVIAVTALAILPPVLVPATSPNAIVVELFATMGFFYGFVVFAGSYTFVCVLSLGSAIHGVEIRENGVVCDGGRTFIPWSKMKPWRWKARNGRLLIHWRWGALRMFRVIRVDVPLAQFAQLWQIVQGKVEVRDQTGQPIPPPSDGAEPPCPLEEPPASRRRLQFGLKTALLIVLVAASACSWYAMRRGRWVREERAMAGLAPLQAEVLGALGHAWSVNFSKCPRQPNDEDLAALAELPWLEMVDLSGVPITDAGAGHLKGAKRLQYLFLRGTNISDAGLVHLRELRCLHVLVLSDTQITGAGLVHLRDMKNFTLLLANTQVNDAGMKELSALASLHSLSLAHTGVTDAGLIHLKGLHELETLDLEHTQVTDAGVASLSALPKLGTLFLTDTNVDDAVIEHLLRLPRLEHVTLAGTKVTEDGRKRLRAARPNLNIQ